MMGEKPFKKGKACSACAGVCNDGLCVPKTTCAAGDWVMKGSGGFDGFFNLGALKMLARVVYVCV